MAFYYAVRKGLVPGIYMDWDSCNAQVHGFPGAEFKKFKTEAEAQAFIDGVAAIELAKKTVSSNYGIASNTKVLCDATGIEEFPEVYAFTDGSFNVATGVYGFGGFLMCDGEKYVLQGSGEDEEMASMRNVAGEILGSQAAITKALELGLKELTIYYDYEGIKKWAVKEWKRNKAGTIAYSDFIDSVSDKIKLTFVHVKAHTGIDGNEEADILAKQAVGIE